MGLGLGLGESTHRAFIGLSRCHVHVEPSVAPPERQGVSWYSGLASRPEVYSCGLGLGLALGVGVGLGLAAKPKPSM